MFEDTLDSKQYAKDTSSKCVKITILVYSDGLCFSETHGFNDSDRFRQWNFVFEVVFLRSEPKADFELPTSDGKTKSIEIRNTKSIVGDSQDIQSFSAGKIENIATRENYARYSGLAVYTGCMSDCKWHRLEPPMHPSHQRLVLHPGP